MSFFTDLFHARQNRKKAAHIARQFKAMRLEHKALRSEHKALVKKYEKLSRELRPTPKSDAAYCHYQCGSHREGTRDILNLLERYLDAGSQTAIEIGCAEGVIAAFIATMGKMTLGIEKAGPDPGQGNVHPWPLERLHLSHHEISPKNIGLVDEADIILLLSVHHQWVEIFGEQEANKMLEVIASKARKQFFFMPAVIREKYGGSFSRFQDNDFAAVQAYFTRLLGSQGRVVHLIGDASNLLPAHEPRRPMFLVEPAGFKRAIPTMDPEAVCELPHQEIFDVEISKCRLGLIQSPAGFYVFSHALGIWKATASEQATEEALSLFYQRFQPQTWAEVLSPWQDSDLDFLHDRPADGKTTNVPWLEPIQIPSFSTSENNIPVNHWWGPMSESEIKLHTRALINLIEQIKERGYFPPCNSAGYVCGYLLRKDGQTRFNVTDGQHRVAVLHALGLHTIRARFQPFFPKVVDYAEAEKWPAVKDGLCSAAQARRIFDLNFNEDGTRLGRHLGFLK